MSSDISASSAAAPSMASVSPAIFLLTIFPSIMLPMFLAALDQTIVATALPSIAASLNDATRISWIVVSYLLAATVAAPVYGKLGDSLGRRNMLFVALPVFIAASALCALSHNILIMTIARLLQGMGGGGLMTLSQALIGESVPPRERGRYQGYLASVFMAASTFGPVMGGYLTQHYGWQSVFLINIPIGMIAMLLALRLPNKAHDVNRLAFDSLGLAFFTGFIVALLLALEQIKQFTLHAVTIALLLVLASAVCFFLLIRQEKRFPSPLLPIQFLRQPAIWRTNAMAACVGASLVSMISFVPIYMQVVRGTTPAHTGFLMLPLTICIAMGALCTGRMITKTGRTAIFPSFGLAFVTGVLLFAALFIARMPLAALPVIFACFSLPMGSAMPVVQTTVQAVAGSKLLGSAAASVQFSRSVGAAIGTAAVGTVLFASLLHTDPETAAIFTKLMQQGPKVLTTLPAARQSIVQGEIASAFRAAFFTVACFTGLGWVMALLIPVRRI